MLEWECALKDPEQGAAEGAPFIARHLIKQAAKAFDDFAGTKPDKEQLHRILGIGGAQGGEEVTGAGTWFHGHPGRDAPGVRVSSDRRQAVSR